MKYILSAMSNSVGYTFYGDAPDTGVPPVVKVVTIAGGANLPSLTSGFGEQTKNHEGQTLWTPSGMVTAVSDSDFDALMNHNVFRKHLDAGYIKPVGSDLTGNHAKIEREVRSLRPDEFAPMTPDRMKDANVNKAIKVTTGKENSGRL